MGDGNRDKNENTKIAPPDKIAPRVPPLARMGVAARDRLDLRHAGQEDTAPVSGAVGQEDAVAHLYARSTAFDERFPAAEVKAGRFRVAYRRDAVPGAPGFEGLVGGEDLRSLFPLGDRRDAGSGWNLEGTFKP